MMIATASNSWNGLHWARTSDTLTFPFGGNTSGRWDARLATANADWNALSVLNNSVDPGRTNPRNSSPGAGLSEICNPKYDFNGWLGIAGVWVSGGERIATDYVKVNDSYFNTSTDNTPEWCQLLMCLEVDTYLRLCTKTRTLTTRTLIPAWPTQTLLGQTNTQVSKATPS